MKLRTRLAALTVGATAAVAPLAAMPAVSAAPSSTEAAPAATESGGQEYVYWTWFWDQATCIEIGWNGVAAGLWYDDFICLLYGTNWTLWINPT